MLQNWHKTSKNLEEKILVCYFITFSVKVPNLRNKYLQHFSSLYITFFMLCTKFLHRNQPEIHMVPPCSHARAKFRCLKQRNGSFFSFSDAQSGRKCAQLARRNNSASCIVIDRGRFVSIICSKQPNIHSFYVSHARSMFYGFCFLERVAYKLHWDNAI